MAYRESYYEQREREKAAIREAIKAQIARQNSPTEEPVVAEPDPEPSDVVPDESWTKAAIQQWLSDEGIYFTSSMTKADLLELI